MVNEVTIQSAKAVDLNIILDEFQWEKDRYGNIRCPSPAHNDSRPSCSCSASRNTCKCFSCGEVFDTIDLYQCLSEKVYGVTVPFYKAVENILGLDAEENGSMTLAGSSSQDKGKQYGKSSQPDFRAGNGNDGSPYGMIISNSRPLTGYELNYLHGRGIMLYDSYVYGMEVHTVQGIGKALQTGTGQDETNRLKAVKDNGIFHKGIAPILKANRIQIRHNFWQGVNSIIYLVDYDADDEDDLCCDRFFSNTVRHMAVQKTLDGNHIKRALGESDFIFITQGFGDNKNRDIYICEGIEDALSCAMNGIRSISLNSTANLKSLVNYLAEEYVPCHNEKFVTCFDHDAAGRKAAQELKGFFESYNKNPCHRYKYSHAACDYPQQFHDINDYWVSRVFR
ncbi:MAG: toprim domain-containing protein [Ruminococcus flavefaciens]|nr:toprim domain-containing protein [Ruminococcus flavefaciens]